MYCFGCVNSFLLQFILLFVVFQQIVSKKASPKSNIRSFLQTGSFAFKIYLYGRECPNAFHSPLCEHFSVYVINLFAILCKY